MPRCSLCARVVDGSVTFVVQRDQFAHVECPPRRLSRAERRWRDRWLAERP